MINRDLHSMPPLTARRYDQAIVRHLLLLSDHDEQRRSGGPPGRCVLYVIVFTMLFLTTAAQAAEISVRSDRNPVNLNESFELIFTAGVSADDEPDFSPLQHDFDILSQAQSSNISVINGDYSKTTSWTLTVMAKREGLLTVPPIAFGRDQSQSIRVTVKADLDGRRENTTDADILLEVVAEPTNPYVQQQVIVTVRLLHRVEIAQASLSEPELSDTVIEKLGKDSQYQTRRNGLSYAVVERKYAIFPQQSGPATIPPLELNAQVVSGRRSGSMFNGLFNRQITRNRRERSNPVTFLVRPIPAAFTGQHWLPAEQLHLQQHWSTSPPATSAGEPITRTLTLTAKGVTVSQLPEIIPANQPIRSARGSEIKQYPDQPTLDEKNGSDGLISLRTEKTALIPSSAGDYIIPPITIPWWNTRTEQMEIARLPEQLIKALPSAQTGSTVPTPEAPADAQPASEPSAAAITPLATNHVVPYSTWWPWMSLILATGWALTCIAWWLSHKRSRAATIPQQADAGEKKAIKALKNACSDNHPEQAKDALLAWAAVHWPNKAPRNLAAIVRRCGLPSNNEIDRLNHSLYARQRESWRGKELWQAFLDMQKNNTATEKTDRLRLEPLYKT